MLDLLQVVVLEVRGREVAFGCLVAHVFFHFGSRWYKEWEDLAMRGVFVPMTKREI